VQLPEGAATQPLETALVQSESSKTGVGGSHYMTLRWEARRRLCMGMEAIMNLEVDRVNMSKFG
jgi:hypothetical protein